LNPLRRKAMNKQLEILYSVKQSFVRGKKPAMFGKPGRFGKIGYGAIVNAIRIMKLILII
jgi:hypothetical protein